MNWLWGWTVLYVAVLFTYLAGRSTLPFGRTPHRLIREFSAEAHPFMPFAYLANLAILTWGEPLGSRAAQFAITGMALAGWFLDKDDDERWKRRRRRLGGKVRSLGHRLVVAPAGAK